MTYNIDALKALGIAFETTFGTSQSGSVAYQAVPFTEANFTRSRTMHEPGLMAQHIDSRGSRAIVGQKNGTLDVGLNLVGAPVALSSSVTTIPGFGLEKFLGASMGGVHVSAGAKIVAVAAPHSFSLETGQGNRFPPGSALAVRNSSTGLYHCSPVLSRSGDQITLAYGLGFTPVSGSDVFAGYNFFLKSDPTGSLQAFLRGDDSDDTWIASGLNGGFTLETPVGELATANFSLAVANHVTGGAQPLGLESYTGGADGIAFYDSKVIFTPANSGSSAATTRTEVDSPSVSPNVNISYGAIKSQGGVNGIVRWRRLRSVPVAAPELQLYYADNSYFTARDLRTPYRLDVQVGSQVGGNLAFIQFPNNQIMNVERSEAESLNAQTLTLASDIDATTSITDSAGSVDLSRSAIRITLF